MQIVQPSDPVQRRQALAVLMARPEMTASEVTHQIDVLVHYADKSGLSLEQCLTAMEAGRCVATCLCVDAPGRTSSVFLPATCDHPKVASAAVQILKEAVQRAAERDIQFLQGMISPESLHEKTVFRQAGFEELTQLIYLEADSTRPLNHRSLPPTLKWTTYSQASHALFAKVVLGSYEDSLDCSPLNGVRDIEDILASHRSAGPFDPNLWLVGMAADQPVGAILLAQVPDRFALEVVYMGLLKAARGQGYGAALLRRGLELARENTIPVLSLTVDYRNDPALKLYLRFGFREISRRDVWIKILRRVADEKTR